MRKTMWITALAACVAVFVGCGGGAGTPEPDTSEQDAKTTVDAAAVAEILEVVGYQDMGTMVEIQCRILQEADIVVEYPAADGSKTLELHVAPPHAVITTPGYSKDAGGKIVIKPKE